MLRRVFRLLPVLALVVLPLAVSGCDNSPASPSGSAPYSQTDLVFGTGAAADTGKTLTVKYTGWFYDASKADRKGVQFSTSELSGPVVFVAGQNSVIAGWEKGVLGMMTGGVRRLVVPPSLAYGPNRYQSIPPNATLVFELELLGVQ